MDRQVLSSGWVRLSAPELDIDMPIFCQEQYLIQIVICDVQRRAVQ